MGPLGSSELGAYWQKYQHQNTLGYIWPDLEPSLGRPINFHFMGCKLIINNHSPHLNNCVDIEFLLVHSSGLNVTLCIGL